MSGEAFSCVDCGLHGPISEGPLAEYYKETTDIIARETARERENPICDFVRKGIFLPLGGVCDPALTSDGRRIYAEKENGEEIITPEEWILRRRIEDGDSVNLDDFNIGPHFSSISYNPAYSDYLPLIFGNRASVGQFRRKAKADHELTPLMWSVPFRGRKGSYCGFLHTTNDLTGEREQLNIFCSAKSDYVSAASIHCWRLGCSGCAWDTCIRKAREVEERLIVYRQLQLRSERRLVHVVVSPPQEAALHMMRSSEGMNILWARVFEILKEFQVDTGAVVFHPWREDADINDEIGSRHSYLWRAGPHFHCLGYGFVPEDKVADFVARTGWVIKVVHDQTDVVSPKASFAYLLSHAGLAYPIKKSGIGRQSKAFRFFGGLSNGEIARIAQINLERPAVCPECGGPLIYYDEGFKPVSSTLRIGIFSKRRHFFDERASFNAYCDDFKTHMAVAEEEGSSIRDMDNYDRLWYFCRREKLEFQGKAEFFNTGDISRDNDEIEDPEAR